jgi:hypothetical protein
MTVTGAITVENVTLPRLWSCLWAMSPSAGRRQWRSLLARLEGGLLVAGRTLRFKLHQNVVGQLAATGLGDALVLVAESGRSICPSCAGPACPDRARRGRAVRLIPIT